MDSPLGHNYSLDTLALARSLVHLGDTGGSLRRLRTDLDAGSPLTIGVIGASVAQNGGCINQPGQRCMAYNGQVVMKHPWGERRPHKGFAVRLLELVNATWPHAGHRLVNAAHDGTPAQNMLPCLFTHVPRKVGLVVIEFGSLALHLHLPAVEAVVRKLQGLQPPPVIVFLTIRGLCKRTPRQTPQTIRYVLNSHWELYTRNETTAWVRAEHEFTSVCKHYGVACLSLYEATIDAMLARAPGFSLEDVSLDCLHPSNGRRGTDYLFDTLVNWLERGLGLREQGDAASRQGPTAAIGAGTLPQPMHPQNENVGPDGTCYTFGNAGSTKSPISQRMRNVPWRSAQCDAERCEFVRARECPDANSREFRTGGPPPGWSFCKRSLNMRGGAIGKISPGVLALKPGAELEFTPDTRVQSSGAADDPRLKVQAGLEFLVSWEGMGRVALRCVRGCTCHEQRLDAHRTSNVHNESIFLRHFFHLRGAAADCTLALRVLNESSSGAHKFKVRSLFVAAGDVGARELMRDVYGGDRGERVTLATTSP